MSLEDKVCPQDITQRTFENAHDAIRVFLTAGSPLIGIVKLQDGDSSVLGDIELDSNKNALFVQSESMSQEVTQLLIKTALDQFKFISDDLKVTLNGEVIDVTQSGSWTVTANQGGVWTVAVSNFPTDFPDAGTHTRLDTANGYLLGISLWDYATETTLALAKAVLDTIKTVLDNIFARQADGTQKTQLTDGTNDVTVTGNRLDVNSTFTSAPGVFQVPPKSFANVYSGQQVNTNLITPAAGKRIHVYGVLFDTNAVGVITAKTNFVNAAGVFIWQSFFEKQKGSGPWMPLNQLGGIDESVVLNTTGFSATTSVFVSIAYDEV